MSEKNRTFKQLQKEKSLEELNSFSRQVTEAYALSPNEYSQTNAALDNHLTKKGLRDLMDYAIVIALVSREIATKVLEKSIENQQRKAQEAGGSSLSHHQKIIRLREKYLADGYSRTQISKIAKDFATSSKPISYYTKKYEVESDGVIRWILERAITENIASDSEMKAIIKRSLKTNNTHNAKLYFEKIKDKRKEYKRGNP